MAVEWASSADRHGIARGDAIYAMTNPHGVAELEARQCGERVFVYVGPPHAQARNLIEVIAAILPSRKILVFHVMELSDFYRPLARSDWNERN